MGIMEPGWWARRCSNAPAQAARDAGNFSHPCEQSDRGRRLRRVSFVPEPAKRRRGGLGECSAPVRGQSTQVQKGCSRMLKTLPTKRRGFTLIELLVVIAIIAI